MNTPTRQPSSPSETDPQPCVVCGRTITSDPAYFPRATYQGKTIYFCTEFCLAAYRSDPQRFYTAHSRDHSKD
jgi:YHS domain-containing protein